MDTWSSIRALIAVCRSGATYEDTKIKRGMNFYTDENMQLVAYQGVATECEVNQVDGLVTRKMAISKTSQHGRINSATEQYTDSRIAIASAGKQSSSEKLALLRNMQVEIFTRARIEGTNSAFH
jgi:hypothetical protein